MASLCQELDVRLVERTRRLASLTLDGTYQLRGEQAVTGVYSALNAGYRLIGKCVRLRPFLIEHGLSARHGGGISERKSRGTSNPVLSRGKPECQTRRRVYRDQTAYEGNRLMMFRAHSFP